VTSSYDAHTAYSCQDVLDIQAHFPATLAHSEPLFNDQKLYCWRCRIDIPMLDEHQWQEVMPRLTKGSERIRRHIATHGGSLVDAKRSKRCSLWQWRLEALLRDHRLSRNQRQRSLAPRAQPVWSALQGLRQATPYASGEDVCGLRVAARQQASNTNRPLPAFWLARLFRMRTPRRQLKQRLHHTAPRSTLSRRVLCDFRRGIITTIGTWRHSCHARRMAQKAAAKGGNPNLVVHVYWGSFNG
jgi:hypothetical protein